MYCCDFILWNLPRFGDYKRLYTIITLIVGRYWGVSIAVVKQKPGLKPGQTTIKLS